jgi:hypothetical protein
MKLEKDETIYKESRIAEIISSVLFYCLVSLTVLVVVAIFTIIGVQLASAIWGDYEVIYWLADLI